MEDTALEEAARMPDGMMDNMDDLFGEQADELGIPVTLPPVPLPSPLVTRVADMQRIGCST
jgi:hypothetical protein